MRLLLLFAFLLLVSFAWAQKPLVLHGNLPDSQLDISSYTSFYEDLSGDTLPLSIIKTKLFQPFLQKRDAQIKVLNPSVLVIWLHFSLRNTHPTDTIKLFYHVGQGHGQVITFEGDQRIDVAGFRWALQQQRTNPFEVPLVIPPRTAYSYWVRIMNSTGGLFPVNSELMTIEASWKQNLRQHRDLLPFLVLMSALAGSVLFMGAYALYHYYLTQDKAFLYYSLYAGFGLFHMIIAIDFQFNIGALIQFYPPAMLRYPFNYGFVLIFYALFVNQLFQISTLLPRLWETTLLLMVIIALQQGIMLIETLRGWPLFRELFYYRLVSLVTGGLLLMVLLVALIRSSSPIRVYILAGNGIMFGLVVLPLIVLPQFQKSISPWYFVYLMTMLTVIGFTAERFCFAMALAYRSRLSELARHQMQQQYSEELEAKLAQQAKEIQQQSQELEAQHIKQLETEFERKLADTEMIALRAQMNPHFIFNCLNSIKLYTLQNNSEQASDYLSKFARLIRLVLENSRSEIIPLKNELEALQLYSELEAMRFKQKVKFILQVSPNVDTQYLKIPPLLLQPYLENAIWHGLMHKPEGGMVKIQVNQPSEELLRIEITDDGVGRAKATELKSKSTDKHKSFGLQVTADRIRMINHLYDTNTQVKILDLVDNLGEPCGTKVVLEIPVN